jgi:hypothetical protein
MFQEFLNSYPISEAITHFRTAQNLINAGYEFMGDLPEKDEDLLSIPGIGINHFQYIFEGYGIAAQDFHNMR